MYEPRRVAEAAAPVASGPPTDDRRVESLGSRTPRYAAPTITDRLFARGGAALAVVTVTATAGAVAVSSSGGAAVALGTQPVPTPSFQLAEAAAAAVPMARTLAADQLAAPNAVRAKVVSRALVSVTPLYATSSVNVRKSADGASDLLGTLKSGARVSATATIDGKYRQVEYNDGYGWVLASGLSATAPADPGGTTTIGVGGPAGTTWNSCSRGSAVENRLRKDTVHIYRSVCALFPQVNSYGGWRPGGLPFHKNGRALDIMLTPYKESALGHRIANYLIAHAKAFNVNHIIFEQHIWTPQNPHWRKMADRGSITANHFNHVHVAINA